MIDTSYQNSPDYRDSAQQYLIEDTSFAARRRLIRSLIEENNITRAETYLSQLEPDTREVGEFKALMNILIDLKNQGLNIYQMNDNQVATFETIATDSHQTALYAQAVLSTVNDTGWTYYPWKYEEEESQGKWLSETEQQKLLEKETRHIKVYPNPAYDRINFQYQLPDEEGSYKIKVINRSGKLVTNLDLEQPKGTKTLSTKTWSSGLYFYKLTKKQSLLELDRFVILK